MMLLEYQNREYTINNDNKCRIRKRIFITCVNFSTTIEKKTVSTINSIQLKIHQNAMRTNIRNGNYSVNEKIEAIGIHNITAKRTEFKCETMHI